MAKPGVPTTTQLSVSQDFTVGDPTPKPKAQTVALSPSPRYGFFYGVDQQLGQLFLFSGAQGTTTLDPAQDTWQLDMRADPPVWQKLLDGAADGVPPGRRNGCAVWDPSGPRLLVFGGTADAKTSE